MSVDDGVRHAVDLLVDELGRHDAEAELKRRRKHGDEDQKQRANAALAALRRDES